MQNSHQATEKKSKKKLWILAVASLSILSIIGFFILKEQIERPDNLGPGLEYIGKEKGNCAPPPFSFICISKPYHTYYFATELTADEIKAYFKNAKYRPSDSGVSSAHWTAKNLHFSTSDPSKDLTITYYDNPDKVIEEKGLKKTGKKNLINLTDSNYELAKSAL